jgi:hypothetical protein
MRVPQTMPIPGCVSGFRLAVLSGLAVMALSLEAAGVLLLAGAMAGVLGAAGGITSLVSFPALLAVGVPTLSANVTNLVALVACCRWLP